jgi:hypothetical protein
MNRSRSVALIALLALTSVVLCSCSDDDTPAPTAITNRLVLRDQMRELWTAHTTWTRVYLISTLANLPDQQEATDRLLRNQDDIGDAIRPFYGDAAGDRLTTLLREHILGAAALVTAAQGRDPATIQMASDAWYANADEIARFLADANPNFDFEALREMMHTHLDQTLAEATARLMADWDGDVAAYDAIVAHIDHMADALTDGIAAQFPNLVSASPLSARDEDVHITMRALWQDHVTWTRVFLIVSLAGLPDAPAATTRLLRNQDDLGNAIRPFYGDAAGDQLSALLRVHIMGAAEVVAAAAANDMPRLNQATTAWYTNGDQIADFLAAANPGWDQTALREMMRTHLDTTTTEAVARITADWHGDVVAYDAVVVHILHMSDFLSDGISTQFPE